MSALADGHSSIDNDHYPDLDDTAVVVMALDRAGKESPDKASDDTAIARGREWVEGLQCKMAAGARSMPTMPITISTTFLSPIMARCSIRRPPMYSARCIGMLAQLGEPADSQRMKAAVNYLIRVQEKDGSWFGRWGVNYIYGTWSALAGLNAAGLDAATSDECGAPPNGLSRSKMRMAAGAKVATATSSITKDTRAHLRRPRRPRGRCSD